MTSCEIEKPELEGSPIYLSVVTEDSEVTRAPYGFTIPNDTEPANKTSGIRLGTPAMTTRGFKEEEFIKIAKIISKCLNNINNEEIQKELKQEVLELTNR